MKPRRLRVARTERAAKVPAGRDDLQRLSRFLDLQLEAIRCMTVSVARPSDPVEAIMSLFVSRDDAYAVQGSREEIEAGRAYCKVDGPITRALIQDHLDGKTT